MKHWTSLAVSLALAMLLPGNANAARRLSVAIDGGNITVDYMGGPLSDGRIAWLVRTADRSTCRVDPRSSGCDGIMSPGDRVVMGDNYLAHLDLTRSDGDWGGGGGGLLRGLWMLAGAGDTKNFKYIDNAYNHAPNNLLPGQGLTPAADAHEFLVQPACAAGTCPAPDPERTFRATSTPYVNIFQDGAYNPASGSQHLHYHFHGELTQGNGTTSYPYNSNIGEPGTPSKIYFHVKYWFFNNQYPDGFHLQVMSSIDAGHAVTQELNSFVSSMGFSKVPSPSSGSSVYGPLRFQYLRPTSHAMAEYNYVRNSAGACVGNVRFAPWSDVYLPPVSGQNWWAARLLAPNEAFSTQFKVDAGDGRSNFRVHITDARLNSYGVSLQDKAFQQVIYDYANGVIVEDAKVGDMSQCGMIGRMHPGHWIQSDMVMRFEY